MFDICMFFLSMVDDYFVCLTFVCFSCQWSNLNKFFSIVGIRVHPSEYPLLVNLKKRKKRKFYIGKFVRKPKGESLMGGVWLMIRYAIMYIFECIVIG